MTEPLNANLGLLHIIDAISDRRIMDHDGELQTVTGYYREEYRRLRESVVKSQSLYILREDDDGMILAAINNLSGYPHGRMALVGAIVGVELEVGRAYGQLYELILPHLPPERLNHRR